MIRVFGKAGRMALLGPFHSPGGSLLMTHADTKPDDVLPTDLAVHRTQAQEPSRRKSVPAAEPVAGGRN